MTDTRTDYAMAQKRQEMGVAGQETGVLREKVSRQGRRVTLSLDCGKYQRARPYYTVAYFQKDGQRPQVVKYPSSEDRAEDLFCRFCEDVTTPSKL